MIFMQVDQVKSIMNKEEAFRLLSIVYNLTNGTDGEIKKCLDCIGCPCEAAESGEHVTLLPYEAEYIACKLKKQGREDLALLINTISEAGICPFLKEDRCSIHNIRPIDCRSYPVVPKFDGIDLSFAMSKACPHWMQINDNQKFVDLFKQVWIMLLPLLGKTWCEEYILRNQTPIYKIEQPTG